MAAAYVNATDAATASLDEEQAIGGRRGEACTTSF
jgi:hypothetical protein